MKKNLKILSLQFKSFLGDKEKNFKKVAKLMKENIDFQADIVILPEVWNTGLDYKNFQKTAEYIPEQTTMLLSGLAENYKTYIIGGSFIEKTYDGKFYNTCVIFDRQGAVVGTYRKNYIFSHCGSLEGKYIENGNEICIVNIEGIKVGIGICYDIRFPELFRKMAKEGAEIFAIPAAFPQERIKHWNILNQARALENLAFLLSCNQFGNSNLISPYGEIIQSSSQKEEVIRNIIQINEIFTARKDMPFLKDIRNI